MASCLVLKNSFWLFSQQPFAKVADAPPSSMHFAVGHLQVWKGLPVSRHMKRDAGLAAQGKRVQGKLDRRAQRSERPRSSVAGRARQPCGIADTVYTDQSIIFVRQAEVRLGACTRMQVTLLE